MLFVGVASGSVFGLLWQLFPPKNFLLPINENKFRRHQGETIFQYCLFAGGWLLVWLENVWIIEVEKHERVEAIANWCIQKRGKVLF